MPGDDSIDQKRVYDGKRPETTVYVAGGMGLTRVAVAGDRVGRFTLAHGGDVRDVAGGAGRLLVGTATDVLREAEEGFDRTDFGPAAAVGRGTHPIAAGPDGDVAVLQGEGWDPVGTVSEPRAADGDLLAAGDGVYRVTAGGLDRLREGAATDVAAAGPYAACPDGLYELPDRRLRDGEHTAVAVSGCHAHAVTGGDLFVRRDGWDRCELSADGPVADVAGDGSVYAVTTTGTLLVRADPERTADGHSGWRSRALGVREVRRLAVP